MRRSDTRSLSTFELLLPRGVTFTFPPSETTTQNSPIRITLAPQGEWKMPLHWHPSETREEDSKHASKSVNLGCDRVSCIEGHLHVSVAHGISGGYDKVGSAGMSVAFSPAQRIQWDRPQKAKGTPLCVDLVADEALWRNICSAILDRDLFPQLESTPWWLRSLFGILMPAWRDWLLNAILQVQLQAIFFSHDFNVYHGYFPATWPWVRQPWGGRPPNWARSLQIGSMYLISTSVMGLAYWTGTLLMGIKGEYPEYTPEYVQEK